MKKKSDVILIVVTIILIGVLIGGFIYDRPQTAEMNATEKRGGSGLPSRRMISSDVSLSEFSVGSNGLFRTCWANVGRRAARRPRSRRNFFI